MATYQLRLFQRDRSGSGNDQLAEVVEVQAASDQEALAKAPTARIAPFDNSDYAVLFDASGREVGEVARYA